MWVTQRHANSLLSKVVLLAVLAIALVVRLWGVNYGLPYGFGNGDEDPLVLNSIVFMAFKTLHPVFFNYPALYSYILLVVYTIAFFMGQLAGQFVSLADMIFAYSIEPGNFYLLARSVTALFGTASIAVTYLLGSRAFGKPVGIAAAWLLALSSIHVAQSHWALPDIPMTFFSTVALYFIYRLSEVGENKYYIYAGIMIGLAISTKYNAGLLVIPLLVAHVLRARTETRGIVALVTDKRLIIAYALVVYSFVLASPFWILDFSSYFAAFQFESTHMRVGHLGNLATLPWLWVLTGLFESELVLGVAFLSGVVYALLRPSRTTGVLLSYVVVAFLYIGSWSKTGLYYLLPIWPVLALLTSRATCCLACRVSDNDRTREILLAALALIMVLPSGKSILETDYQMSSEDTRAIAKDWIEANIPSGTGIGLTFYSYNPPLLSNGTAFTPLITQWSDPVYQKKLNEFLTSTKTYRLSDLIDSNDTLQNSSVASDPFLASLQAPIGKSTDRLRADGIQYIILSSYVYERYWTTAPPPQDNPLRPVFVANKTYFEGLFNSTDIVLMMEFAPDSANLGPIIKIYQLKVQ